MQPSDRHRLALGLASRQHFRIPRPPQVPTRIGDALILQTTHTYTVYAVGRVSHSGQQDFSRGAAVKHEHDDVAAVAYAKALVAPGGRIFLRNIDRGDWSEISS